MKKQNKSRLLPIVLFSALSLTQMGMSQTGAGHLIVTLSLGGDQPLYKSQMKKIRQLDLDVAGVDLPNHQVDVVIDPSQEAMLHAQGFNVVATKSTNSRMSPDQQYQNPTKIENLLKQYAAAYPNLAEVHIAGQSLEGRNIFVLRITGNISVNDPSKPHILFNGMHHAREVMATEIPLDTIDTLLTQYGKDPKITHWVDANEIWVMPMFNVDGNNLVWTKDSMWRKNSRGGYGVDINRNYPYQWNSCNGSSNSQDAEDYHGPSAASEPETLVMMNLVKAIRPVFDISYHSYSQLVIYPYGCPGEHTPTKEVVEGIGDAMATKIVNDNGKGHYVSGISSDIIYAVDGSDLDWMYHEAGVIPYVIEVNSSTEGFQPSYSKWRNKTVARLQPAWQFLLDRLDGPSIHGQVVGQDGKGIAGAQLHLDRTSGGVAFTEDAIADQNGFFDVIVTSGTFKVLFSNGAAHSQTQNVTVGNTRVEVKPTI